MIEDEVTRKESMAINQSLAFLEQVRATSIYTLYCLLY
jgi:hypothetical protein